VDRQLLLCLPVLFVQSWKAYCLVDVRTRARFAVHWVSEWYCKYPFFSQKGLLWVSVAEWWKLRTWNPAIASSSLAYPDEIVLELFQCSVAFLNNWFAFRELEFLNLEGTYKLDGFSSQLECNGFSSQLECNVCDRLCLGKTMKTQALLTWSRI